MTQTNQNQGKSALKTPDGMLRVENMVTSAMLQIPQTVVSQWKVRKGVVPFDTEFGRVEVRFAVNDRDGRYPIESTRFYLDRAPISKRRLIQLFSTN